MTTSEEIRVNNAIRALLIAKDEILPEDYQLKNEVYNTLCELHNKYLSINTIK